MIRRIISPNSIGRVEWYFRTVAIVALSAIYLSALAPKPPFAGNDSLQWTAEIILLLVLGITAVVPRLRDIGFDLKELKGVFAAIAITVCFVFAPVLTGLLFIPLWFSRKDSWTRFRSKRKVMNNSNRAQQDEDPKPDNAPS